VNRVLAGLGQIEYCVYLLVPAYGIRVVPEGIFVAVIAIAQTCYPLQTPTR
jgi:hypothetical protein